MVKYQLADGVTALFNNAEQIYQTNDKKLKHESLTLYMAEKGTLKDKLSALNKMVLDHPTLSIKPLQSLIALCKTPNKKEMVAACKQLTELFSQSILPGKEKFNSFSQSLDEIKKDKKKKGEMTVDELSGFYLEHKIKFVYGELLRVLENLLKDNLYFLKKEALAMLSQLSKFEEMRTTVLSLLVNKFGDGDLQLVNFLTKTLREQVTGDYLMLGPLLKECDEFLFRKNISNHAQFYCLNFLSNLNLKLVHERQLATLMQIYFKLFKKLVLGDKVTENEDDINSKLFLNAIKGINKLFPLVKGDADQFHSAFQEKTDDLYRIVHTTDNTKIKVQLLLFLYQSHHHLSKQLPDRYYRCLYDFLLDPTLPESSLLEMFIDLLLISCKQDPLPSRVQAMLKRLLQLCFTSAPPFIITVLLFVSNLAKTHAYIMPMLQRAPSKIIDDQQQSKKSEYRYDMFKREPAHAHAEISCLWEMNALLDHYHPTVRKFASLLMTDKQGSLPYQGANPLLEFSLTTFMEKMALKPEKRSEAWKIKNRRVLANIRPSKYETILSKPVEHLQQHESFLANYLKKKSELNKNKKKIKKDIEEFADQVIEKEMDRLQQKDLDAEEDEYSDDDLPDISEGDEEIGEEDAEIFDQMDQSPEIDPDLEAQNGEEGDEDLDGEEGLVQEMDDYEQGEGDEMMDEEDYDDQQDYDDEDMDQEPESDERDFDDVFDKIGEEEPNYGKKGAKRNKPIKKQKQPKKSKKPSAYQLSKNKQKKFKQSKKEYKKNKN